MNYTHGSCVDCPQNFTTLHEQKFDILHCVCEAGFYNDSHTCIQCLHGTYKSNEGNMTCDQCPLNSTTTLRQSLDIFDCICDPGFFETSHETCTICPENTYKDNFGDEECTGCTPDSSSLSNSDSITDCLCDLGFSGSPGEFCNACQLGKYRSEPTQYFCSPCPENTYNDELARKHIEACQDCPSNTESYSGSGESIACVCVAGFHYDVSLSNSSRYHCIGCGKGKYQTSRNSSHCIECPVGFYSQATEATTPSVCEQCPDGSYTLQTGTIECTQCPTSTYQNTSIPHVTAQNCSSCPSNSQHEILGSISRQDCKCLPGYYAVEENLETYYCEICSPGFYCPGNQMQIDCAHNHYSVEGSSKCVECAPNSFGERITNREDCKCLAGNQGSFDSHCIPCRTGTFQATNFTTNNCSLCPIGTFQPSTGSLKCEQCPHNSSTTRTGSVPITSCICEAHFFGPLGGPCTLCPRNTFCPGGLEAVDCRKNSITVEGQDEEVDCLCKSGYFGFTPGGSCQKCTPGYFCGGNLDRQRCSQNSTSSPGSHAIQQCICLPGQWRNCIITSNGLLNSAGTCEINYTLPCVDCGANTICLNNSLQHCPDFSISLPGTSEVDDCICLDGYFRVDNKFI